MIKNLGKVWLYEHSLVAHGDIQLVEMSVVCLGPWCKWMEGWAQVGMSTRVPTYQLGHVRVAGYFSWWLRAPGMSVSKDQGGHCKFSYNLISEIQEHLFCHILLVKKVTKASPVQGAGTTLHCEWEE